MPKETKVVKNAPPKQEIDILGDPDDITQQLLAETQNAKQMFNQQEVAKKDNEEKHRQIKKQRDQKFIDLMDDLDI